MADKKKLLFVTELYSPSIGGQEIRFQELAEELAARGYTVSVLCIDHLGNLPEHDKKNGVQIERYPHSGSYKKVHGGRKISDIFRFTYYLILHLRSNQYDFIYINQWPLLPALIAPFLFRKTLYKIDFVEYRENQLWKAINKAISLLNRENFVCISESIRKKLTDKTVDILPSLVRLEEYRPQVKENAICFLGRLEAHKNPELAITAFLSAPISKNYRLHIIGGGSLLEQLAEKYAVQKSIIFHGNVDNKIKIDILGKSKVLLLPSNREGMPKSVIEAIASGCAVITTNHSENHTQYYVGDNNVGMVCSPTQEAISQALMRTLKDLGNYYSQTQIVASNHSLSLGASKIERIFDT